jgi:hypothetical protein
MDDHIDNPSSGPPNQPPPSKPRRKRRKRNSGRRPGGDTRSKAAQAATRLFELTCFDLRAHGFTFKQISEQTGRSEDMCRAGYMRHRGGLALTAIEDARLHAQYNISDEYAFLTIRLRGMRRLLLDKKTIKLFDTREYCELVKTGLKLMERESKMMGYDAPSRREWIAEHAGTDLLTATMLDNLNDAELRQLFTLLEIARTGRRREIDVTPTAPPPTQLSPPAEANGAA